MACEAGCDLQKDNRYASPSSVSCHSSLLLGRLCSKQLEASEKQKVASVLFLVHFVCFGSHKSNGQNSFSSTSVVYDHSPLTAMGKAHFLNEASSGFWIDPHFQPHLPITYNLSCQFIHKFVSLASEVKMSAWGKALICLSGLGQQGLFLGILPSVFQFLGAFITFRMKKINYAVYWSFQPKAWNLWG